MKSQNKKAIVAIIIFSFLFVLMLFIGFIVPTFFEGSTESNTIELNATINYIELIENEKENSYNIYTEEYHTSLVFSTKIMVDQNYIDYLQKGQIIIFRFEQVWAEQFNDMQFIYIVTLRTQDKEIITLDSYNKQFEINKANIKITAIVFSIILLLIIIQYILLLNNINIFKKGHRNR